MSESLLHGGLGDFVEDHSLRPFFIDFGGSYQMPRNRFTFAIWVGRQENLGGSFDRILEVVNRFTLVVRHAIFRLEVVIHVYRKLRHQQIADMAFGCLDGITSAEEVADTSRFSG